MLDRLLPWRSKEKLWQVGDHRVKSYQVRVPGTAVHGDTSGVTARRRTCYKCVDCEKKTSSREEFKKKSCYDVIDQ